jgi:endo-1,4-beta-mannosidase
MMRSNSNPTNALEIQEILQKIRDAGYADLIECLLDNEKECYTKKGRLNKSSTCRRLNWKGKQLEDALQHLRELLKNEFDFINLELEDEDEDE